MSKNNGLTTFADVIANIYMPLNNKAKFKEKYRDDTFKILLNPKDSKFATLITVDRGILSVNSIENTLKKI